MSSTGSIISDAERNGDLFLKVCEEIPNEVFPIFESILVGIIANRVPAAAWKLFLDEALATLEELNANDVTVVVKQGNEHGIVN